MDDSYLRIKVNWDESAMSDSTELWATLLRYSSAGEGLFDYGSNVTVAGTDQFSPGDSIDVVINNFCEGRNEAVAVVLSLVPTMFDTCWIDCDSFFDRKYNCMPRVAHDSTGAPQDLEFEYSFVVIQGDSAEYCPFLSTAVDGELIKDNNVLAGALLGHDELDLYPLRVEPTPTEEGRYHLRLSESRQDHSLFDEVQLFAIDLAGGAELATGPNGTPVVYESPLAPTECYDNYGNDLLALVLAEDDREALVPRGGWIEVRFPAPGRAGGGAGASGGPGQKIDPPAGGAPMYNGDGTVDLTSLCYREELTTRMIDIPTEAIQQDGTILLRMEAPVEYYVDRFFFATYAPATLEGGQCALVSATHSKSGSVLRQLSAEDASYAELVAGEQIDLLFEARAANPMSSRQFILASRGRYEHLDSQGAFGGEDGDIHPLKATAHPNPAVASTRIRFSVPSPGGLCSVRIYNIAGKVVRELGADDLAPGTYELAWDGRNNLGVNVAAGVYFIRVDTPHGSASSKLVIIK